MNNFDLDLFEFVHASVAFCPVTLIHRRKNHCSTWVLIFNWDVSWGNCSPWAPFQQTVGHPGSGWGFVSYIGCMAPIVLGTIFRHQAFRKMPQSSDWMSAGVCVLGWPFSGLEEAAALYLGSTAFNFKKATFWRQLQATFICWITQ